MAARDLWSARDVFCVPDGSSNEEVILRLEWCIALTLLLCKNLREVHLDGCLC